MSATVLTDDDFDAFISSTNKPVLVDVWATWCAPCRALSPVIDELALEFAGELQVVKVDADANPQIVAELGVSSIPSIFLIKDSRVVGKMTGVHTKQQIAQELLEEAAQ